VFFYGKEFSFVVEVTEGGATNTACADSEDLIL